MARNHRVQYFVLLLIIWECKSMDIDAWWTISDQQEHHYHYFYHMEMNNRHLHPISSSSTSTSGRYATKQRSFNQIYKVIVGNPFLHPKNIYAATAIYPRTPVWNFKKDV